MATGAAIIHLYPVAQPSLRVNLALVGQRAVWVTRGSLAAAGTWRADVLVRTVVVDQYRTQPFTFTVGPGEARPTTSPGASRSGELDKDPSPARWPDRTDPSSCGLADFRQPVQWQIRPIQI
jgi:hypothetical protein